MLEAGQLVAGRYRLESPIGEGAMAAVWRAEDQTLRRQVAIKFLFVRGTKDPQAMVDQFLREARIAASVQHRNVIHTVDFGTLEDVQPFMVMELLSGESLGDRFDREPALTAEQVVHLVSLTLRGLAAVHDAGIVHRDLKPHNIFLQRDADAVYPKILDFGISRSLEQGPDRPSAIATQEGLIVGTPDYMAPEQARGEANIDRRADIYGMGVILYEGLSGRLPFEADTIGDLIVQIMTAEPPTLSEVRPDTPPALSALVSQAMAKDRALRFGDARAMRRALLAAVEQGAPPPSRRALSLPPPAAGHAVLQGSGLELESPAEQAAALAPGRAPVASSSATWGDFEGLDATRVTDLRADSGSPEAARPEPAPSQRRIVAGPGAVDPRQAPSAGPVARDRARKRRGAGAAGRGESAPVAAQASQPADDPFDPLGAGKNAPAMEIDYGRVRASAPKPQRAPAQRARRRMEVKSQRPRARLGFLVLPLVAAGLLAWMVLGEPGGDLPPSETAASSDLEPLEPPPTMREVERAPASAASSGAASLGRSRRTTARRANPKRAPAHMRDVVF